MGDLRVAAKNPPDSAVLVNVVGGEWIELAIPPAMHHPFEHLVVMRRNMLTCIHGQTDQPPWASLTDDDLLLASVRMPANTSTVQNSQIVDRRAFTEHGRVGRTQLMDTNGGRAAPCRGEHLIEAIRAAMADFPNARFEGNHLGQVCVMDEGFVGYIDVRALGVAPEDANPADYWENLIRG